MTEPNRATTVRYQSSAMRDYKTLCLKWLQSYRLSKSKVQKKVIQFPKMNVRRLLSYEAKLLFSEGRGRM